MGTCGCRNCPKKVESPVKHIATMTTVGYIDACVGTSDNKDAIEVHTRKCAVDSAKNKVLVSFAEYLKLEADAWELIEVLKAKILAASQLFY